MNRSPESPTLSVVIPTLGRHAELIESLGVIDAVLGPNLVEVIVVFDGVPRTRPLEPAIPTPVRTVFRPTRSGPAVCRNVGARAAQGDFLVFLDDDVHPCETWLASASHGIAAGRKCQTGPVTRRDDTLLSRARAARYDARFRALSCGSEVEFLAGGNTVIDRRLFFATGGFPELEVGSDSALIGPLRDLGEVCHFCPGLSVGHQNDRGYRSAIRAAFLSGVMGVSERQRLESPTLDLRPGASVVLLNLALWFVKAIGRLAATSVAELGRSRSVCEGPEERDADRADLVLSH